MHVGNADAGLVAALLQRVVQTAAQDGQDVGLGREALLGKILQDSRRGRFHGQVGLVTDDLGRRHQMARSFSADDIVPVGQSVGTELIDACAILLPQQLQRGILWNI